MLRRFRRGQIIAVASIVLVIVVGVPTVASVVLDKRLACERTAAWATAHAAELPTSLEGLSDLPLEYRRAAFHLLTPDQKAVAWRDQLTGIASDPSLSEVQRDWLLRTADGMRAERFAAKKIFDADNSRIALEAQALFGFDRAREVIATLGPTSRTGLPSSRLALVVVTQEWIRRSISVDASPYYCICSTQSDWCHSTPTHDNVCQAGGCDEQEDCGTLWFYRCDGLCVEG
jgi:hypothetical protein